MSDKNKRKEQTNKIITAVIKEIQTSNGAVQSIGFSASEVFHNSRLLIIQDDIQKEYEKLIKNIKALLGDNKPSYAPRKKIWEVGDLIVRTRENIGKKWGVYITNMAEAIAVALGYHPRFIQYMIQFREFVPKHEVCEDISWTNYKELLDLKNKDQIKEGVLLIKTGKLRTREQIRKYVREKNKEVTH